MNPSVLRLLWTIIEETEPRLILRLQGDRLADWLIAEMQEQQFLTRSEVGAAYLYLRAQQLMIREMAQAKLDDRPPSNRPQS